MSEFVENCRQELDIILNNVDEKEIQQKFNDDVMEIVELVSKQGHSGVSIVCLAYTLSRLLLRKPLSALTGEESEWFDEKYDNQWIGINKRYPEIVRYNKDNNTAKIVTAGDIDKKVTFPYYPK